MKVILFIVFLLVIAFVLFHVVFSYIETIKNILNPRPRMSDNGSPFNEVVKIKTQNMYFIKEV